MNLAPRLVLRATIGVAAAGLAAGLTAGLATAGPASAQPVQRAPHQARPIQRPLRNAFPGKHGRPVEHGRPTQHHRGAHHAGHAGRGVVFVANDAVSGNVITAYDRSGSGRLVPAGSYPTGGLGGVLSGSVVDHLASEHSLSYDHASGLLYAVDAGSDTIAVFAVHGDRLTRLDTVASGGSFPVSIAASGHVVYVLNARGGGSIQGFVQQGRHLVPVPSWHRGLGLDPAQTPEFTSTAGQIGFTPDGRHLIVTTKNGANSVDVYALGPSGPAAGPVVTSLPGAVPFGFAFDGNGDLAIAEAGPNAVATFRITGTGALVPLAAVPTGQQATCWITADGDTFYVSNAGSATESRIQATRSGALVSLDATATDAGTVDASVSPDGRDLYVQTGGTGTVDAYAINPDGSLTAIGSVLVPDAVGGEGIVAL